MDQSEKYIHCLLKENFQITLHHKTNLPNPFWLPTFASIMQLFNTTSRIIVTCSNRLSPFLQAEVEELGFKPVRVFKTGVELKGTLADCIKLNLNLRCASQVLFSISEFMARNADDLYNALLHFEWEDVIAADHQQCGQCHHQQLFVCECKSERCHCR